MVLYVLSYDFGYGGTTLIGVYSNREQVNRLVQQLTKEDDILVQVVKINSRDNTLEFSFPKGKVPHEF